MIDATLRSLIEQCNRHTGRGNMIVVNQTMLLMIERLAEMIEQRQCTCGSATAREPLVAPELELVEADDAEDPTEPEPEHYQDPIENPTEPEPVAVKRKVGRPRRVA